MKSTEIDKKSGNRGRGSGAQDGLRGHPWRLGRIDMKSGIQRIIPEGLYRKLRREAGRGKGGRGQGGLETVISFLHIGKTGGTQMAQAIRLINAQRNNLQIVKHQHSVVLRDLPHDRPFFFGIRDPASRFRSGFYSRKRMGRPAYDVSWTPHEALAFAEFEHANDLAEALFSEGRWAARPSRR